MYLSESLSGINIVSMGQVHLVSCQWLWRNKNVISTPGQSQRFTDTQRHTDTQTHTSVRTAL